MTGVLPLLVGYGHGFGHLGSVMAHAAVWSLVGRFVWHAGPVALVAVAAVALIWFALGPVLGRRRGRD